MKYRYFIFVLAFASLTAAAFAQQQTDRSKILESMAKDGCVALDKVKACKYDYVLNGNNVEAISFRPAADGRYPALLLVPGYQRTAADYLSLGRFLAEQGFASLAVSQPGFGKSAGKADYVGPLTIETLTDAFKKFQREPFVDATRMGVFGYSRGGMAASLLAVELKDIKAVVLGAGIYDFQKAYDEMKMEGIRQNMRAETGMTEQAVKERSSILRMNQLQAPVLILHGEKDENVPVSQAVALRDRLTELKKDFEIKLFPNADHGIPRDEMNPILLDFLNRRLKAQNAKPSKGQ